MNKRRLLLWGGVILILGICLYFALTYHAYRVIPFDLTRFYTWRMSDRSEFDVRTFDRFSQDLLLDRWGLIDAIKPGPDYVYWEARYRDWGDEQLAVYNGDTTYKSQIQHISIPGFGFFVECHPGICSTYIAAVRADGTVEVVDSEEKLRNFIGKIDNLEEAILSVKSYDYYFDWEDKIAGAYKEEKDRLLLYLLEYSSFPSTYVGVKAILYKDGRLKILDKYTYRVENLWIIE